MVPRSLLEDAPRLTNDELAAAVRLLHCFDRFIFRNRAAPETLMPLDPRLMVEIAGRRAPYDLKVRNQILDLRERVPLFDDLQIISGSSGDDLDTISASSRHDLKMRWPKAAKHLRSGVPTETKTETRPNRSQSQSSPGAACGGSDGDTRKALTLDAQRVQRKASKGLSGPNAHWVLKKVVERFGVSKEDAKQWIEESERALAPGPINRQDAWRRIEEQFRIGAKLPTRRETP